VALVSDNPAFLVKLKNEIRDTPDTIMICSFDSGDSFLATHPIQKADLILSDQRGHAAKWNPFLQEILKSEPDLPVIFIIEEDERNKAVEMIKAGVYDVITSSHLSRVDPLLCRIERDNDQKANLRSSQQVVNDMEEELKSLENRLLEAEKLETIGTVAGGLAHDFNNILATISGYSEMLLSELPKSTPPAEKVSRIIDAVTKARLLTDKILTIGKKEEQEKIPVNVFDILCETIGFVRSAKPDNISIDEEILKTDIHIYADPTQLFRVFLNLMINAIQSMDKNGGTLTVKMVVVDGDLLRHDLNKSNVADEYVLISFEDTGEGIDPSVVDRIFEPHFTTRQPGRGRGLGLSVVHGIISEIEGEITVSSKMNKGSLFSVYLPVRRNISKFGNSKTAVI
jgi:signal transduction histidine kinase